MKLAPSEAMKRTAFAISSGVPRRPIGTWVITPAGIPDAARYARGQRCR